MADVSLTARQNEVWVAESPQDGVAGEAFAFTLTVPYTATISSGVNTIFKDRAELSTSLFASTTATTSGNVFTASVLTTSTGVDGRYVVNLRYVNGNNIEIKKLLLRMSKQTYTP